MKFYPLLCALICGIVSIALSIICFPIASFVGHLVIVCVVGAFTGAIVGVAVNASHENPLSYVIVGALSFPITALITLAYWAATNTWPKSSAPLDYSYYFLIFFVVPIGGGLVLGAPFKGFVSTYFLSIGASYLALQTFSNLVGTLSGTPFSILLAIPFVSFAVSSGYGIGKSIERANVGKTGSAYNDYDENEVEWGEFGASTYGDEYEQFAEDIA